MITDTSPSSVAAATIYGIWNAVGYIPTESDKKYVEDVVFNNDYESIPNFDEK